MNLFYKKTKLYSYILIVHIFEPAIGIHFLFHDPNLGHCSIILKAFLTSH